MNSLPSLTWLPEPGILSAFFQLCADKFIQSHPVGDCGGTVKSNPKQAKEVSRPPSSGKERGSKAHTTFDEAIRDAESLLQHCENFGVPLPQEAEVFKRAGLVMAMTAWETYIEDRVREGLRSKTSTEPTYAEKFMISRLDEDLKRLNNPNCENTRKLFLEYLGTDVTDAWKWANYEPKSAQTELNRLTKLRGEAVHRAPCHLGGPPRPHLVKKDDLEKAIRFLKHLVLETERSLGSGSGSAVI